MQIVLVLAVLVALLLGLSAARAAKQGRAQYRLAIRVWRTTDGSQRLTAMRRLLADEEVSGPAWYLCGCAALREYRCKEAARAFGMAHHADCNLETAALLTFACLKAGEGENSDIVEQIVITWREMKEFDVSRTKADRQMLACLRDDDAPSVQLSPLGCLAWSVVGPALRPKLSILAADTRWAALRGG
jgi:hypothetical protein